MISLILDHQKEAKDTESSSKQERLETICFWLQHKDFFTAKIIFEMALLLPHVGNVSIQHKPSLMFITGARFFYCLAGLIFL